MTGDAAQPFGPHLIRRWWRMRVIAGIDHREVIEKVEAESGWTSRYLLMTVMAAGIAMLGLLLSSPAVVIGAMLLSPLMGPIIGFGFSLALFDFKEMRESLQALALGAVIAVLFAALIVLLSPIQTVTSEIAARTRPNLFDLIVAILSAIAGSYAMIRGREGTIVGVAIATALMPPLATVGFGLATRNWTVFGGALLLFFTNLMAIALTASVMARLYGFGSALSPKQTRLQAVLVLATFVALAVPLGLTLRQIGWEAVAARQARDAITSQFPGGAQMSGIDIDYATRPMRLHAVIFTPEFRADAERSATDLLTQRLNWPVDLSIDQVITGRGTAAAEQAQLGAARERQQAQDDRAAEISGRLALVAGVKPEAVTIDRQNRRALVRAQPLPGASLATYRGLEARAAGGLDGWTVQLIPPLLPLPDIGFEGDKPNPETIALIAWTAERAGLPVALSGADARIRAAAAALKAAGIDARTTVGNDGSGVRTRWATP